MKVAYVKGAPHNDEQSVIGGIDNVVSMMVGRKKSFYPTVAELYHENAKAGLIIDQGGRLFKLTVEDVTDTEDLTEEEKKLAASLDKNDKAI